MAAVQFQAWTPAQAHGDKSLKSRHHPTGSSRRLGSPFLPVQEPWDSSPVLTGNAGIQDYEDTTLSPWCPVPRSREMEIRGRDHEWGQRQFRHTSADRDLPVPESPPAWVRGAFTSFHEFHELSVVVHDTVPHLVRGDICEELLGTFDFALFDLAKAKR